MDTVMVWKELTKLWGDSGVKRLALDGQKYAIISDTHLGDGGSADDFRHNELALLSALSHYHENGYSLILLGDIEELWQFDLDAIEKRYKKKVYATIKSFGDSLVHRIFGNHDSEWGGLLDPVKSQASISRLADEAIILTDASDKDRILLVHGHQGSVESQKYAWFSRFFVRIFKGIEPLAKLTGLYGHSSATHSQIAKDYERTLYHWAKLHKVILICGHSHRAIFASKSYGDSLLDKISAFEAENSMRKIRKSTRKANYRKIGRLRELWQDERQKGRVIEPIDPENDPLPCYFNSGCALYTDGITTIEIGDGQIKLVKWNNDAVSGPKFEVFNSGNLETFIKAVET